MLSIINTSRTESTNSYLKGLLLEKELKEGTIVVTDNQTAGRGQRGNSWEAELGKNLTFSLLLYPHCIPIEQQFIISQTVSLAVKDTLDMYTSDISIKWPNDIYWKEKKIGGILIENILAENRIDTCIIGIGLNINQTLFTSDAPNPVSLNIINNTDYDLKTILDLLGNTILLYYNRLKSGYSHQIIENYKSNLFRKEGYHLYNDGEKNFRARIKNILSTGHLVLEEEDGNERSFAFKEVKYIL